MNICMSVSVCVCMCVRVCVCVCVCACAFPSQFPTAAPICVATLDLHVKTHIYGLFIPTFCLQGVRCWFLSSPVDSPSLHAHIHTHSHSPVSSQPLPSGRGYAVSCRLGLSLGVRLEANLREKKEWSEKAEKKERKQNRSSVQLTRKGTKEQTGRQKEADHETKALWNITKA